MFVFEKRKKEIDNPVFLDSQPFAFDQRPWGILSFFFFVSLFEMKNFFYKIRRESLLRNHDFTDSRRIDISNAKRVIQLIFPFADIKEKFKRNDLKTR